MQQAIANIYFWLKEVFKKHKYNQMFTSNIIITKFKPKSNLINNEL